MAAHECGRKESLDEWIHVDNTLKQLDSAQYNIGLIS